MAKQVVKQETEPEEVRERSRGDIIKKGSHVRQQTFLKKKTKPLTKGPKHDGEFYQIY